MTIDPALFIANTAAQCHDYGYDRARTHAAVLESAQAMIELAVKEAVKDAEKAPESQPAISLPVQAGRIGGVTHMAVAPYSAFSGIRLVALCGQYDARRFVESWPAVTCKKCQNMQWKYSVPVEAKDL